MEHRCRHFPDYSRHRVVGHDHRRYAHGRITGAGRQAFAGLALHHHQHRGDGGNASKQIQYKRRGDVVWKVGHQGPRVGPAQEVGPVDLGRIGLDHLYPAPGHYFAKHRNDVVVDLHCRDMSSGVGQCERERTEPRADLNDRVAGANLAQAGDAANGVGVNDKILTERSAGLEAVRFEQLADLAKGMGHCGSRGRP